MFSSFFSFRNSGHQRPPAQLGALRGLRRNQARRRRLGDEFAPGDNEFAPRTLHIFFEKICKNTSNKEKKTL